MKLQDLRNNSYVPYSGNKTAAIVQSSEGVWFPGVRIENISFPLTISAAQNAIFCCLSEAQKPAKIYLDENTETNIQFWIDEFDLEILKTPPEEVAFYSVTQSLGEEKIEATLKDLLKKSVSPYSNFPVSAILETSGIIISGINIEISSWNQGLCAERVALAKAITYGYSNFKTLHIHTRDGEYNSPCGACRQVIVEHLPHHPVCLHHTDSTVARHFTSDLLPYNFQSSSLQSK